MNHSLETFGLASQVLVWQAATLTFISFAVGILGGFVGLALGTVRFPVLLLLNVTPATAASTNIFVSSLSTLAGGVRHLREGRVNGRIVLVVGLPTFAGAFIGGFGGGWVPEPMLILLVGVLVFWQGVELVARARSQNAIDQPYGEASQHHMGLSGTFTPTQLVVGGGIGLTVGLVGGAVGLILGSIRLPALIRVLRVDPRIAAGSNMFIGFIMGSVGWFGRVLHGEADYPLVVFMGVGAMIGSYYGARMTGRVSLNVLTLTMGWVLLAVSPVLMWQALAGFLLG